MQATPDYACCEFKRQLPGAPDAERWAMHTLRVIAFGTMLAVCVTSCSNRARLSADISVQNDSTNHLDWAKVEWGGHSIDVGVMPPGKSATLLDFGLPSGVTTNTAVVEFINEDAPGLSWASGSNEEVRARRANSVTRVPVDVTQLLRLSPEHYQITFQILSLTNATVLVKKDSR